LLATTLTVAAGCGGGNEDRVKVSLALDAPPNASHARLFVAHSAPSFGSQAAERWRTPIAWMQAQGLLAKPVEADSAFTNGYVEEIGKKQ
jgi:hypothetical protein